MKSVALSESKALQFRMEAFNTFNHSQFFGPVAVEGDLNNATVGRVIRPPRRA